MRLEGITQYCIATFPGSKLSSSVGETILTTKPCPLKKKSPVWTQRLSNFGSVTTMARQGICPNQF